MTTSDTEIQGKLPYSIQTFKKVYMHNRQIRNEIEKYLIINSRHLDKLIDLRIERKDDGLIPSALRNIDIDEHSIIELAAENKYRFEVKAIVCFHDPASKINSTRRMVLGGVAQISSIGGREYVSDLVFDSMHEDQDK